MVGSAQVLPIGAHLRSLADNSGSDGYVTSSGYSETLGRGVALGMIKRGASRQGEVLSVVTGPAAGLRVRIVPPCAYDVEGARLNG